MVASFVTLKNCSSGVRGSLSFAADVGEERLDLGRRQLRERQLEPPPAVGFEEGEPRRPRPLRLVVGFRQQQIDVVGHPGGAGTR